MPKVLIAVLITIHSALASANIATCETPASGDPAFLAYVYEDQDGQTKSDVLRRNANRPKGQEFAMKASCQSYRRSGFDFDVPVEGQITYQCFTQAWLYGEPVGVVTVLSEQDGQTSAWIYTTAGQSRYAAFHSQIRCN